ncbi:cellulose synthase [Paraburkholderia agricolaris]|uniref:cellulose synthase n=1 Tax=Paraburkholderia agricolaris TaxID=2152888 RepID=UPI0012922A70|nr:cellulose synthase [Paraburkholderia agricolaris]
MSKQKLTILQVIQKGGTSKKTGLPWEIHSAQCILEQETEKNGRELLVGTVNLPKELWASQPGDYLAEFGLAQSMDGKLEPRIVSLVPFGAQKAKPSAGVSAA